MRRLSFGIGMLLAAAWVMPLRAQESTGTVKGVVTDATTQKPVAGVTITVGSRSALSREDGHYILTGVRAGTDTLRTRILGYAPASRLVTVAANDVLEVDLALTPQAVNLTEMVVVGYGEQRAGAVTGAVTAVNADEFNTGRIVSPSELIQNKAAGVQVVESNEPGGGTSIRIRGATSVNASNEPLYVVDGLPLGSSGGGLSAGRDPLNFINPDDIESITVLRDASAAAIYGANAANGVILITTKSGKRRPAFEYSGTASASAVTRVPSMLNAAQFRAAVEQFAPTRVGLLGNANTDWIKQIDRTAYGQEHNFAISGSGATNDYRLSFNFLDQNGILQDTKTRRLALGINYNQKLFSDRLSLRTNIRGSRTEDRFTPDGVLANAVGMGPTQPVLDPNAETGYFNWTGGTTTADNPVELYRLAIDRGTTYRSIGNIQASYSLPQVEGLKANLNLGYDVTKATRENFFPSILHGQSKTGNDGSLYRRQPTATNTVLEGFLSYTAPKPVGPGALDLTAGYSYGKSYADTPELQLNGLSTDLLGLDGIPGARTSVDRFNVQESKLISFFGRANYNVNDKYILAASLRRDGSSRFGKDRAWGYFPSVSAGWRISQESFLRDVKWLTDLKLRASWAKTGNQAFANYLQNSTYTVGDAQTQYWLDGTWITTIRPSAVDPNIHWEATQSYDFGLDYALANGRFSGAIDFYNKKTTDLIFRVPVAAGTNVGDFVTTNIGSMRNRGVELSLSARILDGSAQKLAWTANFTAARNSNRLLTINPFGGSSQQILTGGIAGGVGSTIQVLTPGQPINSFFVYQAKRGANGKPINDQTDANGDGTINDLDLYVDQNGDGIINQNDLRPFKDPAPKWIFGHSSYLAYRKFDLSFTLRAYLGNYVYNNVASNRGNYRQLTLGDAPYNPSTSVLETGFVKEQFFSDYYVENASFLRMDNLNLGYSFNWSGQAARLFVAVQNVFTITGYDGVDPTAGVNGIDNNIYPRARTFTSGVSLRF